MGNFGARVAGVPIDKYCRDGALMAEAQLRACDILDQDVVVAQSDNYYISEGFGMEVTHHPDSTPTFKSPAFSELEEIEALGIPDPYRDGRMPVILEAVERMVEKVKGEKIIRVPGSGPFTLAAHLMGTEKFLMKLAFIDAGKDDEEKYMRCLIDICTEALVKFQKACVDVGADIVQVGDSLASIDMISPAMYRKWAFEYEKRSFDSINPYGREKGCMSILHICGDTTAILEDMADTGAEIVEIDSKVNMKTAKERIGERTSLMGNLDPSAVLLQGTPELVRKESLKVIDEAGAGGGFILGSGCEVSPITPVENIKAMVKAAREKLYPV
jgi:uroporphyrinogen decarboxylase